MNHEIIEGLEQLFDLLIPFSKEFNKRTYEQIFMDKYQEFKELFSEISNYCTEAEDTEAAIEEVAKVMPDKMHGLLDAQGSTRKKENLLMSYNLGMVAFVIPMFRYGRNDICEAVTDRMVELWNDNGLSMNIGKSTYEDIAGGFKSRFCYITTAVCEGLGKPDDCYELNLLRTYRDEYLASQNGGKEIIKEYYDVAPTIVKRISRREDAQTIYHDIWNQYLSPCVKLIEEKKNEECRQVYTEMVHSLQKKYIFS